MAALNPQHFPILTGEQPRRGRRRKPKEKPLSVRDALARMNQENR